MILLEMDALNLATNQVEVLRYADQGLATKPTDAPPNVYFAPRLLEGLRFSRRIPLGMLGGQSQGTFGDIVLANVDGELDTLRGYAFDGREFRAWYFEAPPARLDLTGQPSFRGLVAQPLLGLTQVEFKVMDLTPVYFTRPLLSNLYAGNNGNGGVVEGEPDDLKGQRKPRLYGTVFNIRPRLVNRVLNIYQISDRPGQGLGHEVGAPCVFDHGVPLLKGDNDYASVADMAANAPAAGYYRQYSGAEGLFLRLGSTPQLLTVDAYATAGSTPQAILAAVLKDIGLPAHLALPIVPQAPFTANCGLYVEDDSSALEVIRQICPADNLWFGFDRLNRFVTGRVLGLEQGVVRLEAYDLLEIAVVRDGDDGGAPIRSARVPYMKLHTVQNQVAAGATAARRALVNEPVRYAISEDSRATSQRLLARQIDAAVNMASAQDARYLAGYALVLFGRPRERFEIRIACTAERLNKIDVGVALTLRHPRLSMNGVGKSLMVIGMEVELGRGVDSLRLLLWG